MTAMINKTNTVMIAIVITRLVAILLILISYHDPIRKKGGRGKCQEGSSLPTRHPPQCLHATVHVSLALQHSHPRMLNRLPLQLQIRQRISADHLRFIRDDLRIVQTLRAPA